MLQILGSLRITQPHPSHILIQALPSPGFDTSPNTGGCCAVWESKGMINQTKARAS